MTDFLLRLNQKEFVASLEGDDRLNYNSAKTKKHPALPEYYASLMLMVVEPVETLNEQTTLLRVKKRLQTRIDEIESTAVQEVWIISEELFGKIDYINGPVFLLKGQIPIFLSFHDFEDDPWLDA